jgi:hypothetical protein
VGTLAIHSGTERLAPHQIDNLGQLKSGNWGGAGPDVLCGCQNFLSDFRRNRNARLGDESSEEPADRAQILDVDWPEVVDAALLSVEVVLAALVGVGEDRVGCWKLLKLFCCFLEKIVHF